MSIIEGGSEATGGCVLRRPEPNNSDCQSSIVVTVQLREHIRLQRSLSMPAYMCCGLDGCFGPHILRGNHNSCAVSQIHPLSSEFTSS